MSNNPLYTVDRVQAMANRANNEKVALAMTVISVALLSMMLIKEAKDLFRDKDSRGHFRRWEGERSR